MLDLNYTYSTPEKIFGDITFIKEFDTIWYLIIFSMVILWVISIYFLLPILYSMKEYYLKQKEKRKKKLLLKQILMQREIEDQILKEVRKHS